ncbi:hypothetical protein FOB22_005867 [Saccharomyces cerevisiae]|nr:hypothetical protein FOB22_005867 [Saccharomyces cerevisiae]
MAADKRDAKIKQLDDDKNEDDCADEAKSINNGNNSSYYALTNLGLVNDDELVDMKSNIDDLPDFLNEKPTFTPLDERNVGTRHELNWLIKGILTED